jgi:hypothetical protein
MVSLHCTIIKRIYIFIVIILNMARIELKPMGFKGKHGPAYQNSHVLLVPPKPSRATRDTPANRLKDAIIARAKERGCHTNDFMIGLAAIGTPAEAKAALAQIFLAEGMIPRLATEKANATIDVVFGDALKKAKALIKRAANKA